MKRSRFPDSLVLIFAMIVVAQLLTYVLPAGAFAREEVDGRARVVPGTFEHVEDADPAAPLASLMAIPKGLEEGADIIFLVFVVGGAIGVIRATGAIDALIDLAIRGFGHRRVLLVAGMVTLFALGSSSIGMAEEYMPFIPILVTMCIALRMDAMVAVAIVYVGAGIGYGCAAYNPFTVVIGQTIAELPPYSGQGFRWVMLPVFLAVGVHHVMRYAARIQEDPGRSLVADVDYSEGFEMPEDVKLTLPRAVLLIAFAALIGIFVWGVGARGWYLVELSAIFLGLALLAAVLGRMAPNEASAHFGKGAAEMTTTALLIGFARGIKVVLDEGQVTDTVIHAMATPLQELPAELGAVGMFAVQCVCNFFIPSGSGQAYVTMPIMTPLADLTGISRQTAVLAYQLGDGLTNMVVPTNALLMGMLVLGKIPFQRWLRFVGPLMLKLFVLAAIFLVIAVRIDYA